MNWTKREKTIIETIKSKLYSPSHGLDHLIKVSDFASILAKKYKANQEIVVAAALLHDLGRNNPKLHGKESSEYSVVQAKPILKKADYTQKEIELILQIIREHDQPFFTSKLLESRILKDADFLDGFGFRGLLRSIYFTAEAGQPQQMAIERIAKKMPDRFKGLEFLESKNIAQEQFNLTRLLLQEKNNYQGKLYTGKLIIFEGISGTGKETQARLLAEYLNKQGEKVEIVFHPTPEMKEILKLWRKQKRDDFSEVFFFLADRFNVMQKKVLPALKQGKTVISLRSYISSLVYQAKTQYQLDLVNYLYSNFEPLPDIVFYFDLKPEIALARIESRTKKTGEEKGKFEKLNLLKEKRRKYKQVIKKFKHVVTLDAVRSIDELHKDIVDSQLALWQKKDI
ncbi:dTMP kinase [Candidatus Roizmanbacteria bacterium RIFCSPHIGHO2_02_FULL_37_15]|nr:MAG: dTMP kinase [Candidatus Roizmanbacteria bacterium RIFCSPHIGHO2_02_FULL_37_15]